MANFGSAAIDIDMLEQEIAAKDHSRKSAPVELSGNIAGVGTSSSRPMQEVDLDGDFDTLDEPVWDTVKRDLRKTAMKFNHVIFPSSDRKQLLKDWDLWGPLFICVALSLLLHHNNPSGSAPHFTQVFAITFFGSVIVTLNIKLLGGQISFFQSLCVIGYCLLPPFIAAAICSIFLHGRFFIVRLLITTIGFLWSTFAAMGFLAGCQPEKKKFLVVYPIFLFYFVVSWIIISAS
ncbi:Yip1 domain protein [Dictyocaulus viviparus]|uniref:Protein YIPF n=1 Tax=Dictyocaulus viviparus TaxID=29172 RepID=A0A0D8XTN5_DICVI|nr:Yip1 domain protein [Dictyocaulus viviparus]